MKCPVCNAQVRRMFVDGAGKRARKQRPKWNVCTKGHKLYIKRGQLG